MGLVVLLHRREIQNSSAKNFKQFFTFALTFLGFQSTLYLCVIDFCFTWHSRHSVRKKLIRLSRSTRFKFVHQHFQNLVRKVLKDKEILCKKNYILSSKLTGWNQWWLCNRSITILGDNFQSFSHDFIFKLFILNVVCYLSWIIDVFLTKIIISEVESTSHSLQNPLHTFLFLGQKGSHRQIELNNKWSSMCKKKVKKALKIVLIPKKHFLFTWAWTMKALGKIVKDNPDDSSIWGKTSFSTFHILFLSHMFVFVRSQSLWQHLINSD